ncbi:hypothetical protein ACFFTU_01235 [Streptomyces cremeus]|uniref:Uncharacterized protein n=1 Tax=Streptomyces cremeus TaxID=66881 RepID=A0ABV5P5U8_STRCM
MSNYYVRLSLLALLSCGAGTLLLFALLKAGIITNTFSYKGAVIFAVTVLGTTLASRGMRKD